MQSESPDVESIIIDAIRCHQAGRLNEAERLYRQILAINPHHADSLYLLGLVAYQRGRHDVSVDLLGNAIGIKPKAAEYHMALGLALKAQGELGHAEASYRRALVLKPDFVDAHNNLGNALYEQGRLDEAGASFRQSIILQPNYAEAHNNLGNTLSKQGKLDEAEASYRRALVLKPDFAEAHNNLGTTLKDQGKPNEAEASYRQALVLKPDFAEVHNNLGNALYKQDKLDEAEACYRRSIILKPDFAEAHNNLGNVHYQHGRPDEAVSCYGRALVLKPNFVEAHNNLGTALYDLGKLDEAAAVYRKLLEIEPGYTDALNPLAAVMSLQCNDEMALNIIMQSLQIKETEKNKKVFVDIVKRMHWTNDNGEMRIAMARALTEPWARPDELAQASANLIKLNPEIGPCVTRAAQAWPAFLSAQALFGPNGLAVLAADPLLCALLSSTQNIDIEIERFLTMARRLMLQAATGTSACNDEVDPGLAFHGSLTRQCFINEYVFSYTDDEIREVSHLRDSLVGALEAGTKVPALWVLAVGAYFPLYSLSFAARLLDMQWLEPITAVLVQQIREPAEEVRLRTTIPQATRIEDPVSLLVQTQYEENPYPRWIRTAPVGMENTIIEYLCQRFPFAGLQSERENEFTEFLIAGCGTGQHSVEVAQSTKGRILAVDLSLCSLGYAKRKTLELGLTSIAYAQADLMELDSLGRSFHVIECTGVLHHLADPFAGWRMLLSLLRPGGVMVLGLYSEVARRDVARTRAFISERGYGTTAAEIRRCRQDLLYMDKSEKFGTVTSGDFFGISTCRDLLFHSQEHQMTLTDIDSYLRDNKLKFLGFEIQSDVLHAYRKRFPDDPTATNLNHWRAFEIDNPRTFFGMYNFWIQKSH
jgi:tetratricopeptide (TPR) repeat protein/SAM-dependent methyltransferase